MYIDNDPLDPAESSLIDRLTQEAMRFRAPSKDVTNGRTRFLIADFEFEYDRANFDRYSERENHPTGRICRWPFHHIVAAAWCEVTFVHGLDEPVISAPVVMTAKDYSEIKVAKAYFAAVEAAGDAVLVGWGSEQKDVPVLRRIASEYGLPLPKALIDTNPWSRGRLDLCNAVSAQAASPHLPEYCEAVGIPAKPMPSKAVGSAVLSGDWDAVAEQVLADVMTISIIAARHAIAHRMVTCDLDTAEQAIGRAMSEALLDSVFLKQAGIRLRMHRAQPWTARAA